MAADEGSSKVCKVCGKRRPLTEFYVAEGCADGRRGECRSCFQAKAKARRDADPELREQARQRTAQWIEDNRERYDAYKAGYRKTANYARALRKAHLKAKYGITPDDYERMLEQQGGGCAICGDPPPDGGSLHVDHDHATGHVRSLLCFRCNAGLGQFRHDPGLLVQAAEYVSTHHRIGALTIQAVAVEHPEADVDEVEAGALRRRLDALAGTVGRDR